MLMYAWLKNVLTGEIYYDCLANIIFTKEDQFYLTYCGERIAVSSADSSIQICTGDQEEVKKLKLKICPKCQEEILFWKTLRTHKDAKDKIPLSFIDEWEGKSSEELYKRHLLEVSSKKYNDWRHGLGLHERWAAARILARRNYLPAGQIFLKWLEKPEKGISNYCYGYEHSASTNVYPDDYYFSDDASQSEILILAIESLGLMRYAPAKDVLTALLESESLNQSIQPWIINALSRFAEPNFPETDLTDDLLLYIATYEDNLFREHFFRQLVKRIIRKNGKDIAARYLEALKNLPHIRIGFKNVPNYPTGDDIIWCMRPISHYMARISTRYRQDITIFELMCKITFPYQKKIHEELEIDYEDVFGEKPWRKKSKNSNYLNPKILQEVEEYLQQLLKEKENILSDILTMVTQEKPSTLKWQEKRKGILCIRCSGKMNLIGTTSLGRHWKCPVCGYQETESEF